MRQARGSEAGKFNAAKNTLVYKRHTDWAASQLKDMAKVWFCLLSIHIIHTNKNIGKVAELIAIKCNDCEVFEKKVVLYLFWWTFP